MYFDWCSVIPVQLTHCFALLCISFLFMCLVCSEPLNPPSNLQAIPMSYTTIQLTWQQPIQKGSGGQQSYVEYVTVSLSCFLFLFTLLYFPLICSSFSSSSLSSGKLRSISDHTPSRITTCSFLSCMHEPACLSLCSQGYTVYRKGSSTAHNTTAAWYIDSGLSPSTPYTYSVSAFSESGYGPNISTTIVTPPGGRQASHSAI